MNLDAHSKLGPLLGATEGAREQCPAGAEGTM